MSVTDGNINCADCEKRKKVSVLLKNFHRGVRAVYEYGNLMHTAMHNAEDVLKKLDAISTEIESLIHNDSTEEDEHEYEV